MLHFLIERNKRDQICSTEYEYHEPKYTMYLGKRYGRVLDCTEYQATSINQGFLIDFDPFAFVTSGFVYNQYCFIQQQGKGEAIQNEPSYLVPVLSLCSARTESTVLLSTTWQRKNSSPIRIDPLRITRMVSFLLILVRSTINISHLQGFLFDLDPCETHIRFSLFAFLSRRVIEL